jgi:predicted PurR-regulated permease PerM
MMRYGVPQWLTASSMLLLALAAAAIVMVIVLDPVMEWVNRAPELGARLRERLRFLDAPLAALDQLRNALAGSDAANPIRVELGRDFLAPVLAAATPALSQLLLFFGTLFFFLLARTDLRNHVVVLSSRRQGRLRLLHAFSDVERKLARYLGVVTLVNLGLALVTAITLWLIDFPNPGTWAMLAFILNYMPYLGAATTAVVLLAVGLISLPTLGEAMIAPAAFVAFSTIEGQFVTPAIVGREFTVNPLAVFVSIGVLAWLWGPLGALLAMPILIAATAAAAHLPGRANLPG